MLPRGDFSRVFTVPERILLRRVVRLLLICRTNENTNVERDQEKHVIANRNDNSVQSENETPVITDHCNISIQSQESFHKKCSNSDIVEFIDDSIDESPTHEPNNPIICDAQSSEYPFTSLDKISLEDYKDAKDFGERSKKYSASSHKVQFADMAVFDVDGDIHVSPMRPKPDKNPLARDSVIQLDRNTILLVRKIL